MARSRGSAGTTMLQNSTPWHQDVHGVAAASQMYTWLIGSNLRCCACAQYDVELVQHIEALVGHQLAEHTMDEAQVRCACARVSSLFPQCSCQQ